MNRIGLIMLLAAAVALKPGAASVITGPAVIIGDGVRMRQGPGKARSVAATLAHGQTVEVVGRVAGWYQVKADASGWVAEDYLRLGLAGRVDGDTVAHRALSLAQSLLGAPYNYGGAGPGSFDCSGLVYYIFGRLGKALPHSAHLQMRIGTPVERDGLLPGDLVFFRTAGDGSVSHVGLYLFEGEFIHASSSRGRVTTSTMNESYYNRKYAGAVRLATSG